MAYEEGVNMNMPVAPAYGGNGFGGFGDGWWIILLILCMNNGLWGGLGGNGGGNYGLYPWMNQADQMNAGFQNQMLQSSINTIIGSISGGFADVQNALCAGFAGVTAAITGAQNSIQQQLYTNEMANMDRFFQMQSQFAQCCCDQKMATADLKYTLATEACNNRAAVQDAMQRILDEMCQSKIDAKNERISDLERQLTLAQVTAERNAQTATILAGIQNANCCNGCNNGLY